MFTVQLLRGASSPVVLGNYPNYQEAQDRMDQMLQLLSVGMVEIVSPNGFVLDRESADLFHRAAV